MMRLIVSKILEFKNCHEARNPGSTASTCGNLNKLEQFKSDRLVNPVEKS